VHESATTVCGQLYFLGCLGVLVRDPAGRITCLGTIVRLESHGARFHRRDGVHRHGHLDGDRLLRGRRAGDEDNAGVGFSLPPLRNGWNLGDALSGRNGIIAIQDPLYCDLSGGLRQRTRRNRHQPIGGHALPHGKDAPAQRPPCLVAGRTDARRRTRGRHLVVPGSQSWRRREHA
jgi:hypothetical protein